MNTPMQQAHESVISICIICRYRIGRTVSSDSAAFVPPGEEWTLCHACHAVIDIIFSKDGVIDRARLSTAVIQLEVESEYVPTLAAGLGAKRGSPENDAAVLELVSRMIERYLHPDETRMLFQPEQREHARLAICVMCQEEFGSLRGASDLAVIPATEVWALCPACNSHLVRLSGAYSSLDWLLVARAHDAARDAVELTSAADVTRIKDLERRLGAAMAARGEHLTREMLNDIFYAGEFVRSVAHLLEMLDKSPTIRYVYEQERHGVIGTAWRTTLN